MEDSLLEEIDRVYPNKRYSTRTEFIRDAIRKKLDEEERKEVLNRIGELRKKNNKRINNEHLRLSRENSFDMIEREIMK